ncbi:MAG: hypothetical protein K5773_04345 [Pseudobutyrivibrio sp.]|nr:hypothetical protein [Pseudobutyrivibrio sp.]
MSKESYRKRTKKRIYRRIVVIVGAILLALIATGAYFYFNGEGVYNKVEVELGQLVEAKDFLKDPSKDAQFTTDTRFNLMQTGTYDVGIKTGFITYKSTLVIKDTTPPELEVQDIMRTMDKLPAATDFVTKYNDISPVTVDYMSQPDFSSPGLKTVTIVATDQSGNKSAKDANLTLLQDVMTEPPIIEGELNKIIYKGSSLSYKSGVKAFDQFGYELDIQVDSSAVNLDAEGQYEITYTATDLCNNTSKAIGTITVIPLTYTEDEVFELADQVLSEIITDDMSDYDKAHAIYTWVKGNMGYSESTDRDDWLKGAYDALSKRHGDCYNFFAVSKALLTRAGIKNADIEIIPTATRHHYWNVIDCGEGWRHFDTTPRKDDTFKGFYLTDEELMTYSDMHYHSHNYDREVYTYFND